MPIVDRNSVGFEKVDDLTDEHVAGCLYLNILIFTPNFLEIA